MVLSVWEHIPSRMRRWTSVTASTKNGFNQHCARGVTTSTAGGARIEAALGAPALHSVRSGKSQSILLESLSTEFPGVVWPPVGSEDWPGSLTRQWFKDGGALRLAALAAQPPAIRRRFVDAVGCTLPVVVVEPQSTPTLMGAVESANTSFLDGVAAAIARDDFVTIKLGLDAKTLTEVTAEAKAVWPLMRPGEIKGSTLADESFLVGGSSPSGATRGDHFLLFGELDSATGAFPALARAHAALGVAADAIAPRLPTLEVGASSDTFIARFPGDGLGYGAHYDGGDGGLCRLTAILYTSQDWEPDCGGELRLLDRRERAWWSVEPIEDTLIIFKSEIMLHKVMPCYAPRVALTAFLSKR